MIKKLTILFLLFNILTTSVEAGARRPCRKNKKNVNDFSMDGEPNFDQKAVASVMYYWGFGLAAMISFIACYVDSSPSPTTTSKGTPES
ncbi:MAG: hypothetical protein S4CHLAM102_01740 [Chlamydiia bacterium]|nr:hypothetical protein [Chlamydiia bacterium]